MNADDSVVISNEFREAQLSEKKVIDNFETNSALNLSSCNGVVSISVANPVEILMQDINNSLNYGSAHPSNGMTRARFTDSPHCLVFEWDSAGFVRFTIPDSLNDFTGYEFLSFRACQRTRHPFNLVLDSSINFSVILTDESAHAGSVMIQEYGPVIQTYQRGGGWQNEFCTVRIRLTDFLVNGTQVDLGAIEQLEFSFGSPGTSATGALGIDDIELVKKEINLATTVTESGSGEREVLTIFPNPGSGSVTLRTTSLMQNATCTIYNPWGRTVYQTQNFSGQAILLSSENLPSGLYFVCITQESKIIATGKWVIAGGR